MNAAYGALRHLENNRRSANKDTDMTEIFILPPDLQRWAWVMNQYKSGPRKHPGQWHQFIFTRLHGLAAGDDALDPTDPSLRIKVRCDTLDNAWNDAIDQMRLASAALEPHPYYDVRLEAHLERMSLVRRLHDAERDRLRRILDDPDASSGQQSS